MRRFTYLAIFLLVFGFTLKAQTLTQDFESYTIGDTLDDIGWGAADIEAVVADDPLAAGNNVLQNTIHNYNAAPVLQFVLPAGKTLANYGSFTFKAYFAQGDVGYKDIVAEAYQDSPTAQAYNNASVKIGSWNRAQMGSTAWEDITIDITNSSAISDTFYVAFGINCAGTGNVGGTGVTTIWYADDIQLVPGPTLVSQWGKTSQGKAWPILSTSAGSVSIGGPNPIPGWATIRGEFDTLFATLDTAVVVTGKIELVGATGGGSTYTPLRYALTFHDKDSLRNALTDSAFWKIGPGSGYAFMPRSAAGTVSNGAWGSGTMGVIKNGNWNSSNSNGGPALATVLQAPRNAELIPGTYDFAFSVIQVNDTVNEIKWYLVEETNKYWFGGTVTGPASTTKFNGVCFGVNTGGWTQVNLTEVKVELGSPITVPEAPWEAYYVDQWGETTQGRYFVIQNDSSTLVGDGSIKGAAPINGAGQASIRGGFGQELPIKTDKALIVTGELELVGTLGGESSYNPLRYAITYNANDTLKYALTDSAYWVRGPGYGYNWCPRTGSGIVANGAWGSGTVGVVNNGNWHSTNSNGGPALATILQAPRNAQMIPGTYKWAISVQQVNDTTNEIRWYLIEKDNNAYWFGGIVTGPAVTNKLTGVSFNVNTGDWTEVKVIAAQVDYGDPIVIPVAPWEAYYISQWGFFGGKMGGWSFTPGEFDGNATISGTAANTDWAAVRGAFDSFTPSATRPLKITGKIELVGGGFDVSGSLRVGLFNTTSAGALIVDTAAATLPDSTRWAGTDDNSSGYLFIPQSGSSGPIDWNGTQGTWGAVVDTTWLTPVGYVLGSEVPSPATGGAGTYDFEISVTPQGDGTSNVKFNLLKDNYALVLTTIDNHNPLVTDKFNSIAFGLNTGNSITAMNLTDVQIDTGTVTGVIDPKNGLIPAQFALGQNYPNPFNPSTTIEFALPQNSDVSLVVYDILGRQVTELVKGNFNAGYHKVRFDASNLASGVYFYSIKAGDFVNVKKLMLLK